MSRGRPFLRRGAAAAFGLFLGLAAAELAVRLAQPGQYAPSTLRDPATGAAWPLSEVLRFVRLSRAEPKVGPGSPFRPHALVLGCYDRPRWTYFDEQGCVEYRTNAFGFRDDEFPLEKPPGELRLLAIGDSFTFGLGVQAQDCWAAVLERSLRAERGPAVQVINAGFAAGVEPSQYADWLVTDGLAFGPDVVLIGLCLEDLGSIPMVPYNFEGSPEPTGSELVDWLVRLRERRRFAAALEERREHPERVRPFDVTKLVAREPARWQATQAALVALQRAAEGAGARCVVAVLPMLSELRGVYPDSGLHEMVMTFCAEQGIEAVDLADRFLGRIDAELWVHPTDRHPNDVGHRLIAEGILARLHASGG